MTAAPARRAVAGVAARLLRLSLRVSPRPVVLLVRTYFARAGAATARRLATHAPPEVTVRRDERYGPGPDELLDVVRPAAAGPLPLVVWVPGGGWVGGSKETATDYYWLVATAGCAVAAVRYSVAPGAQYPEPVRQVMVALRHLDAHAARLGVDTGRNVLAGDSAGAHIAAQVAAIATSATYAQLVGVASTVEVAQLRGVVLACGPYDLDLFGRGDTGSAGHAIASALLWTYSGTRHFLDDPAFASFSVSRHLTPAFPPALLTVGNADPLAPQSALLGDQLAALGIPVETVFFPADHDPPFGHEYQFDLDGAAGRTFLDALLRFVAQRLGDGSGS